MFNLFFHHLFYKENFVKSHQQVVAEYHDRTSRINARLSSPGYARVMEVHPDGGKSFYRTYTADYLQYAQSDRGWVLYKVLYSLFLVVGAALSVFVMSRPCGLNYVPYIGALEVLSLIPLVYLLYTMFHQIFAPRRMEIHQHKLGAKCMKLGAFIYGLYLLVPLVTMLVYVITNDFSLSATDVFCIAGFLTDAVLIFLMLGLETKRHCISVPNILPNNVEIIE